MKTRAKIWYIYILNFHISGKWPFPKTALYRVDTESRHSASAFPHSVVCSLAIWLFCFPHVHYHSPQIWIPSDLQHSWFVPHKGWNLLVVIEVGRVINCLAIPSTQFVPSAKRHLNMQSNISAYSFLGPVVSSSIHGVIVGVLINSLK